MEEASTKQTSLFGGFVEEDKPTLTFVKVYEEVVSEGDQFTMHPTTAKFNEDRGCLTLIDANKNQALTVYFEHAENARYTSTPDGVRLGRAVERCLRESIDSFERLEQFFKEMSARLHIVHMGEKGRRWTVDLV
tara:strand:+ start:1116 stop:1517 length:402 start_codon:yes stop_codon:yes gene_type:complete